MSKKDIYIHALEFGRDNLLNGITRNDLRKYLVDKGITFETKAMESNLNDMFNDMYGVSRLDSDGVEKNYLEIDAYFNYVEHQELIEARKSANRATTLAVLAILTSAITAYISITQNTTLNQTQFESFMALQFDASAMEASINNLSNVEKNNHAERVKILENILQQLKSNKSLNQTGAKNAPPG